MPITVNESGVLYDLDSVTSNENGVLYNLDTVHSNEGGTLYEIHSGWSPPEKITWYSRSDAGYIKSQTNNGYSVSFSSFINTAIINNDDFIQYNTIHTLSSSEDNSGKHFLKSGCKLSVTVNSYSASGTIKIFSVVLRTVSGGSSGVILRQGKSTENINDIIGNSFDITVENDGLYWIGIRAYGLTPVSGSEPNYYSASATVSISITRT